MKMQTLTPMESSLLNTVTQMHRAHQQEREEQMREIMAVRDHIAAQDQRIAQLEALINALAPLWGISPPST